MHLMYFDENKYSEDNPFFLLGGVIVEDSKALELDKVLSQIQFNYFGNSVLTKATEFHGKEIFHGKENWKDRKLAERIKAFEDISSLIVNKKLTIRMVCIDVKKHREKYFYPIPEYRLGLMLLLERCCDFLEKVDDIGLVFGDYEKDEITKSIVDFSQFKTTGSTPMYFGRPLGRLIDTVYFTQSHHSRFLQIADMIVFMAGRFEKRPSEGDKWHDKQVRKIWENIKASVDFYIQHWP